MNEECLICKAPLEYLETDTMMECVICHKKDNSKKKAYIEGFGDAIPSKTKTVIVDSDGDINKIVGK